MIPNKTSAGYGLAMLCSMGTDAPRKTKQNQTNLHLCERFYKAGWTSAIVWSLKAAVLQASSIGLYL